MLIIWIVVNVVVVQVLFSRSPRKDRSVRDRQKVALLSEAQCSRLPVKHSIF